MRFQFTPAAERALLAAANWTSGNDPDELGVPEVLLGLLAEPECRSALLLAPWGIDAETVRRQFTSLAPIEHADIARAGSFSAAWLACLNTAESLLLDYPRPLILATEHLLLGIAASDNPVSAWLEQQGLDPRALEAEIHRLSGHQPGPLPLDPDEEETGRNSVFEDTALAGGLSDRLVAMRVIDAAANRAGEALRVIEDYLRFVLDDRHLTSMSKQIRHELTSALTVYSAFERHAARDTQSDVGTDITLPAERLRTDTRAVVAANFKRLEQSLRSLEEFSKALAPDAAAEIEQLRYRVYTLERAADITRASLERLDGAQLYVLVDGGPSAEAFDAHLRKLMAAEVAILQLRDKRLADRELLSRARLLRELTRDRPTLFIMNDRPDLAALADADGVHVGQEELSVKEARKILGADRLIGVSTHSIEQARAAVLDGASYIGVGPTFPSATKKFSEFTGVELLRQVQAEIRLPAFAIGGVTLENLPQVRATGFTRVAVSDAINHSQDPAAAVRQFFAAFASTTSAAAREPG